ncbi:alkaline phosphatase family protein [Brochothrix thermosphacta]|uniref:alkaline phosphatase family protein n=1 Tax=Brochothrix thermosphacta TaxID=2756 RepID=UPI00083F9D14|nr:alkaline phosphatase family protein [Brochothrix thermosphacta]SLM97959.1 hypothetical protein FM106_15170 [Brachybacterium faecium]ANZ96339.1 hypothetical protein BFC20_00620 [Brochothrix thermosphacta]ODJ56042.1 hypothetical protein BFR41_03990 [Brochothrix thermosphacta]ODJ58802.1 hypothetical protein BFR44_07105 [Brochothrix thermosphacta]ODJ61458.1 hypothetical protein BFR35_12130 [Brochothrix thermosphacta]
MGKTIFVVLDGLNAKTAFAHMGFMAHMIEQQQCAVYTVEAEVPAQSRPLYEVLQTGVPTYQNGIYANHCTTPSKEVSVFQLAQEAGLTTGAAAYHWVSELYNKSPFNPETDRLQFNSAGYIQQGLFYFEDHYPDSHLLLDGDYLIQQKQTDYTLIHTMNIDDVGHRYGSDSKEYVQQTVAIDSLLAGFILKWRAQGYQIVVTADHGMNTFQTHNGISSDDRQVPLYIFSEDVTTGDYRDVLVKQRQIAPLLCQLLGLTPSEQMAPLTFI